MDAPWFALVLAVLACWRLTTLLVHDDGPWALSARLRRAAGDGQLGRMLDCFRCASLWVAAPLAWAVARHPLEALLAWPALSGAACLLDRLAAPPPLLQAWTAPEGDNDELLRTSPSRGDAGPGAGARDGTPFHVVR